MVTVKSKAIIKSKFASDSVTEEYTPLSSTTTRLDNFTVTNLDSSEQKISIYLVPSGQTLGDQHRIIKNYPIPASEDRSNVQEITSLKNKVLHTGDKIFVIATIASKLVINASGREIVDS